MIAINIFLLSGFVYAGAVRLARVFSKDCNRRCDSISYMVPREVIEHDSEQAPFDNSGYMYSVLC